MTLDKLLSTNLKITKNHHFRVIDLLFLLSILAISLIARVGVWDMEGTDITYSFSEWMASIRKMGGWESLEYEIGNYTPIYMYFITFLSYLSITATTAFKIVAIIFDYIGAIAIFLLIQELRKNDRDALLASAIFLLLPTVFLASAAWAQNDILYVSMLIFTLYFMMKGNNRWAMIFMGVALSVKFQAIFLLPFVIIMCLLQKCKWRYLLWLPVPYIVFAIPAAMYGRGWSEILTIYFRQTKQYFTISSNYANLYTLLGIEETQALMSSSLWIMVGVLGVITYIIYNKKDHICIDHKYMILLATFTTSIICFIMPGMHDRYGLILDILLFVYAFIERKKIYYAFMGITVSLLGYMPYLFIKTPTLLPWGGVLFFILILLLGKDLFDKTTTNSSTN